MGDELGHELSRDELSANPSVVMGKHFEVQLETSKVTDEGEDDGIEPWMRVTTPDQSKREGPETQEEIALERERRIDDVL